MPQEQQYRGVAYVVEAIRVGESAFEARYRLLDVPAGGDTDTLHPSLDRSWATANEALTYATEAACHAIEILQFGRPQGQGCGSPSTERRTESLGQ